MQRRETGLLLIALAILGASLLTETRRDVAAASPEARDPARSAPAARPRADTVALDVDEWLARLKARGMNTQPSGPGLFGGTSWQPQPDPAAAQPAKRQTPPFPFVLLGRMTLGDSTAVVVSKGDVAYPAKVGQVIEQFRIDRIDEDGLRVTYVPNGESREYRYEQLYASADAAQLPGSPVQSAPQMQQPQGIESPAAPAQPKAPSSSAPAERLAAGAAAATAASAGATLPLNPLVQGAAAPIGGMVITPTPPGAGMVITPTPPGNAMVMTPSASGAGMVITPTPPGALMQFTPGAAPGAAPPQTSP
jgi:hypothetical protein